MSEAPCIRRSRYWCNSLGHWRCGKPRRSTHLIWRMLVEIVQIIMEKCKSILDNYLTRMQRDIRGLKRKSWRCIVHMHPYLEDVFVPALLDAQYAGNFRGDYRMRHVADPWSINSISWEMEPEPNGISVKQENNVKQSPHYAEKPVINFELSRFIEGGLTKFSRLVSPSTSMWFRIRESEAPPTPPQCPYWQWDARSPTILGVCIYDCIHLKLTHKKKVRMSSICSQDAVSIHSNEQLIDISIPCKYCLKMTISGWIGSEKTSKTGVACTR